MSIVILIPLHTAQLKSIYNLHMGRDVKQDIPKDETSNYTLIKNNYAIMYEYFMNKNDYPEGTEMIFEEKNTRGVPTGNILAKINKITTQYLGARANRKVLPITESGAVTNNPVIGAGGSIVSSPSTVALSTVFSESGSVGEDSYVYTLPENVSDIQMVKISGKRYFRHITSYACYEHHTRKYVGIFEFKDGKIVFDTIPKPPKKSDFNFEAPVIEKAPAAAAVVEPKLEVKNVVSETGAVAVPTIASRFGMYDWEQSEEGYFQSGKFVKWSAAYTKEDHIRYLENEPTAVEKSAIALKMSKLTKNPYYPKKIEIGSNAEMRAKGFSWNSVMLYKYWARVYTPDNIELYTLETGSEPGQYIGRFNRITYSLNQNSPPTVE